MSRPAVWTRERLWRVSELLDAGWSDARIADALDTTIGALRSARRYYGLAPRRRRAYSAQRVARMLGFSTTATVVAWVARGWLRARCRPTADRRRHYMILHDDLLLFLEDERHWHRWSPERLAPESGLRWWAYELRGEVRFLTVGQVADRCCVETRTVNNWIRSGRLPAIRNGGWYIREDDLAGFTPPGLRSLVGLPKRRFTPEEDARLLAMRAAGRSFVDIGAAIGRSSQAACNRYHRLMAVDAEVPA